MSKPKSTRPPRPTYTEGFKNGAVELYRTRRREHPDESRYAATMVVGETMDVSFISISNWVKKATPAATETAAELPSSSADTARTASLPSAKSALDALVAVLSMPEPAVDAGQAELVAAGDAVSDDPQVIILELRRELAEVRRANIILKGATAYLASESLKAA
ncbi:MAG TPA: hypothetical protein VIM08_01220 [Arthrobacter sp.]